MMRIMTIPPQKLSTAVITHQYLREQRGFASMRAGQRDGICTMCTPMSVRVMLGLSTVHSASCMRVCACVTGRVRRHW